MSTSSVNLLALCCAALAVSLTLPSSFAAARLPTPKVEASGLEKSLVAIGGSAYGAGSGAYQDVETISLKTNKHRDGVQSADHIEQRGMVIMDNLIYVLGTGEYSQAVSIYNVSGNTWLHSQVPNYPDQIGSQFAVVLNGSTIVTLGGTTLQFTFATSVRHYKALDEDGQPGRWKDVGTVPQTSSQPCAVVVKSSIYYIAGLDLHRSDDGGRTWTALASLNEDCGQVRVACAAIDDTRILVAGGRSAGDPASTTDKTCMYDISKNTWNNKLPTMTSEREGHVAVLVPSDDGHQTNVLVCGGYQGDDNSEDSEATATCEVFDTKQNVWTVSKYAMKHGRSLFGLFVGQTPV